MYTDIASSIYIPLYVFLHKLVNNSQCLTNDWKILSVFRIASYLQTRLLCSRKSIDPRFGFLLHMQPISILYTRSWVKVELSKISTV